MKNLTANRTSMPVKGEAEFIVQLGIFATEFCVPLLLSTVERLFCLLELDVLTETIAYCMASIKKIVEKKRRLLRLSQRPTTNEPTHLTLIPAQKIQPRSKNYWSSQ